ncbi:MAG TPA: RNase P subunit p30 family protein [Candidatus Bathyarchaeia archaeon]|nr:RNase P subunit p30 family protein [Candidatus Bathyarchaeia archaeon]
MRFVDLCLCAPWTNLEQAKRLIAKSAELGYSQIGVPLPATIREEAVSQMRQISEENGLDFVTRLDLAPKSPDELLAGLRRFRSKFEVLAAICNSKVMARQAAKDRRVDLLCFRSLDPRKRFFDRAEAELASASGAALEICLAQMLSSLEVNLSVGFFSRLRREASIAKSFRVPIVFSSGASEPLLLRKPQDYAALSLLFDVDASCALEALSVNPAGVVERNRRKQSSDYVAPGVRVVKEARGR